MAAVQCTSIKGILINHLAGLKISGDRNGDIAHQFRVIQAGDTDLGGAHRFAGHGAIVVQGDNFRAGNDGVPHPFFRSGFGQYLSFDGGGFTPTEVHGRLLQLHRLSPDHVLFGAHLDGGFVKHFLVPQAVSPNHRFTFPDGGDIAILAHDYGIAGYHLVPNLVIAACRLYLHIGFHRILQSHDRRNIEQLQALGGRYIFLCRDLAALVYLHIVDAELHLIAGTAVDVQSVHIINGVAVGNAGAYQIAVHVHIGGIGLGGAVVRGDDVGHIHPITVVAHHLVRIKRNRGIGIGEDISQIGEIA